MVFLVGMASAKGYSIRSPFASLIFALRRVMLEVKRARCLWCVRIRRLLTASSVEAARCRKTTNANTNISCTWTPELPVYGLPRLCKWRSVYASVDRMCIPYAAMCAYISTIQTNRNSRENVINAVYNTDDIGVELTSRAHFLTHPAPLTRGMWFNGYIAPDKGHRSTCAPSVGVRWKQDSDKFFSVPLNAKIYMKLLTPILHFLDQVRRNLYCRTQCQRHTQTDTSHTLPQFHTRSSSFRVSENRMGAGKSFVHMLGEP